MWKWQFENKIEEAVDKLPPEQIVEFAWRCGMRAIPFLGNKGHLNFWDVGDRENYLLTIFSALDFSVTGITTEEEICYNSKEFYSEIKDTISKAKAHALKNFIDDTHERVYTDPARSAYYVADAVRGVAGVAMNTFYSSKHNIKINLEQAAQSAIDAATYSATDIIIDDPTIKEYAAERTAEDAKAAVYTANLINRNPYSSDSFANDYTSYANAHIDAADELSTEALSFYSQEVKMQSIILEDLKIVQMQNQPKFSMEVYGKAFEKSIKAFNKEKCKHWGQSLKKSFEEGLIFDVETFKQRLDVPKEIRQLGPQEVNKYIKRKAGDSLFYKLKKIFMS